MSIEAMKLALEALENLEEHLPFDWAFDELQSLAGKDEYREDLAKARSVIPVLYQAIEQAQKQEPVGWVDDGGQVFWKDGTPEDGTDIYTSPPQRQPEQEPVACVGPWHDGRLTLIPRYSHQTFERDQPLYTSPPYVATPRQRQSLSDVQPLTDEQIEHAEKQVWNIDQLDEVERGANKEFVRAIEAAHGIKE